MIYHHGIIYSRKVFLAGAMAEIIKQVQGVIVATMITTTVVVVVVIVVIVGGGR